MKFLKLFLFFIFTFIVFHGCSSVQYSRKPDFNMNKYNKIAVMDFEGNDKEKGKALAESFVPVLMNAGFDVVERAQLDRIINEQKLAMTGLTGSTDVYQAYKVAGVKVLMFGNFHLQKRQNVTKNTVAGNRNRPTKTTTNITVDSIFDSFSVRIIDASTAEVLFSASSKDPIREDSIDDFFKDVADTIKHEK